METGLFWTKVAAIGQVAGAVATFLAVAVSLFIAFAGRRPKLRLKVGERIIIGGELPDRRVLMFSVTNMGERPVYVRGIGWRTGWLRWAPSWLARQHAVQLTGGIAGGIDPPYELQAGQERSSYADMENVLAHAHERKGPPFFTRDIPFLGRCRTAVFGYVYTADGSTFHARAEPSLLRALVEADLSAPKKGDQSDSSDDL